MCLLFKKFVFLMLQFQKRLNNTKQTIFYYLLWCKWFIDIFAEHNLNKMFFAFLSCEKLFHINFVSHVTRCIFLQYRSNLSQKEMRISSIGCRFREKDHGKIRKFYRSLAK